MTTAYRPCPKQAYIAREGYPFIAIALGVALLVWLTGLVSGFLFLLFVAGFVAFFFRNPERQTPSEAGLVVSPADGRVLSITPDVAAPYTGKKMTKVSIFMSVFNVHINRFPVSARIKKIVYSPGKFIVASLDKASEFNERNGMVLEDEAGREFVMVQIAGLVARRIICYLKEGDFRTRGLRFGLIRFGSRVDLYLPGEINVEVKIGNHVKAGESIIGRFL